MFSYSFAVWICRCSQRVVVLFTFTYTFAVVCSFASHARNRSHFDGVFVFSALCNTHKIVESKQDWVDALSSTPPIRHTPVYRFSNVIMCKFTFADAQPVVSVLFIDFQFVLFDAIMLRLVWHYTDYGYDEEEMRWEEKRGRQVYGGGFEKKNLKSLCLYISISANTWIFFVLMLLPLLLLPLLLLPLLLLLLAI